MKKLSAILITLFLAAPLLPADSFAVSRRGAITSRGTAFRGAMRQAPTITRKKVKKKEEKKEQPKKEVQSAPKISEQDICKNQLNAIVAKMCSSSSPEDLGKWGRCRSLDKMLEMQSAVTKYLETLTIPGHEGKKWNLICYNDIQPMIEKYHQMALSEGDDATLLSKQSQTKRQQLSNLTNLQGRMDQQAFMRQQQRDLMQAQREINAIHNEAAVTQRQMMQESVITEMKADETFKAQEGFLERVNQASNFDQAAAAEKYANECSQEIINFLNQKCQNLNACATLGQADITIIQGYLASRAKSIVEPNEMTATQFVQACKGKIEPLITQFAQESRTLLKKRQFAEADDTTLLMKQQGDKTLQSAKQNIGEFSNKFTGITSAVFTAATGDELVGTAVAGAGALSAGLGTGDAGIGAKAGLSGAGGVAAGSAVVNLLGGETVWVGKIKDWIAKKDEPSEEQKTAFNNLINQRFATYDYDECPNTISITEADIGNIVGYVSNSENPAAAKTQVLNANITQNGNLYWHNKCVSIYEFLSKVFQQAGI
jgi:hypothetical protein